MKTFLIQTVNNEVVHDFSFNLIESIKYYKWYYGDSHYSYILHNSTNINLTNCIPVGTVEFVMKYINRFHHVEWLEYKPMQIPEKLMQHRFLLRECEIMTAHDIRHANAKSDVVKELILSKEKLFIKDVDRLKSYTEITKCYHELINDYAGGQKSGNYFVSEVVDIESEWRAFVYDNKLVGLQNYAGDFTSFPSIIFINQIIKELNYNYAYTIDIGINCSGNFIIECHDFFSCGLYGFCEYKLLPNMFVSAWNKIIGNYFN